MNIKLLLGIVLTATLGVLSCQSSSEKEKTVKEEKPVTKVDVTIDTTNAFNSLFIDSFVVKDILHQLELGDTLTNRIRSFYNSRNYQYAWFSEEGLPEHTISFWNLLKNYLNYSKDSAVYDSWVTEKMEKLITAGNVRPKNDSLYQNLEVLLTKYFYIYADHAYADDPTFNIKSLEWYIPKKKLTLEAMLDSALSHSGQYADEYAPHNPQYIKLRNQLIKYKRIKDSGGWPIVNSKVEVMKKGYTDIAVGMLKKRLKAEGFLDTPDSAITNAYDDELVTAVNAIKKTYGYKPDGTAGQTFLKDVNVPVEERIQQILINMERMRWLPSDTKKEYGRSIMVNIPEFRLHVYENGKPAWNMDVVVGKEGNNTTVFTGRLSTIVFSPYWNVPPSIVKNEMNGKPSAAYLQKHHMEIVKGQVRQKPGPWNSLGLVKFLFPNSYNIYFHDSPAKSLFNRDKRSFSHGCIRLKEPTKLAVYILDDSVRYNTKKVDSLMRTYKEKYVKVKNPVPVLITYFTAWVNDSSVLNFREDIYGHDAIVAQKMFLNSVGTSYTRKKAIADSLQRAKDMAKLKEQQRKDSLNRTLRRDSAIKMEDTLKKTKNIADSTI